MNQLTIIKVGGKVIEDEDKLQIFADRFKQVNGAKVLVHGGGVLADQILKRMGIAPKMLNGRRVTDEETLETVVMVYGGLVNKRIVGILQGIGVDAVGLTGIDGGTIVSTKRPSDPIDYGYAGDITAVETKMLNALLSAGFVPVIAPVTGSAEGQLLNTNADTIAAEVAKAFSSQYKVSLIYGFEIDGVLDDIQDVQSLIREMDHDTYQELKSKQRIHSGMIPKLDNAFDAKRFANRVVIGHYKRVNEIADETTITYTKIIRQL